MARAELHAPEARTTGTARQIRAVPVVCVTSSVWSRRAQRAVTSARPIPPPRLVPVAVFPTESPVAGVRDEVHAPPLRQADAGADRRRLAAMAGAPPAAARHGPAARLRVSEHVDLTSTSPRGRLHDALFSGSSDEAAGGALPG